MGRFYYLKMLTKSRNETFGVFTNVGLRCNERFFIFVISHPSTHNECDDIMKLNGLVVSTIYQYHVQSLLASLKILKCYL